MTSFKYTAATLALLLASGLSYAANTTTTTSTTEQPAAAQKGPECPAAGTVAEADLPADCKSEAAMPMQDGTSTTGAAEAVQPDANAAATTTELPKQDNAAATTTELPKQDGTATTATGANADGTKNNAVATNKEAPEAAPGTDQPQNTTAAATTTEMPKQDAAAPAEVATETAVTEAKASSSVLASQFMGQTVYSASNENVGEINDIVMNRDLDNVVAIIGVGGFLGIGEKDVAISIEEITAVKDENNNLKLTIAATKEQLEAAPAFDRTALK